MTARKLIGMVLTTVMLICLAACGQNDADAHEQDGQEQIEEYVTVILPHSIAGEVTPENLDSFKEYYGLEDAVINADGSVTEIMTRERWLMTVAFIRMQTDDGLASLAGSEQYPHIDRAEVNETYDVFTIYTGSEEIGDGDIALCSRLGGYAYYHAVYMGQTAPFSFRVEFRDTEREELVFEYTQDDWQDPDE